MSLNLKFKGSLLIIFNKNDKGVKTKINIKKRSIFDAKLPIKAPNKNHMYEKNDNNLGFVNEIVNRINETIKKTLTSKISLLKI